MAPITIGGHKAYGVYIMPGMGFRNNDATGIAISDEPEGIYYVIDGKHYDSGCCFDYGNPSCRTGFPRRRSATECCRSSMLADARVRC